MLTSMDKRISKYHKEIHFVPLPRYLVCRGYDVCDIFMLGLYHYLSIEPLLVITVAKKVFPFLQHVIRFWLKFIHTSFRVYKGVSTAEFSNVCYIR